MLLSRLYQTRSILNKTKMLVKPVPCLDDNYSYLILDEESKKAAVVDPVEPDKVLKALEEYSDYQLSMILTTHHHWDHAGGNPKLLKHPRYTRIPCYGGSDRVDSVTHIVKHNEDISLGSLTIKALGTAGHTMDHICYYIAQPEPSVFTGDCLFSSGCGRFFEGAPKDMYAALSVLSDLPDKTKVYFGHEYTVSNLRFALTVEPHNQDMQEKRAWANSVGCTTPSTMENEKRTNPFLRVHLPEVAQRIVKDPESAKIEDILGQLRRMKDDF
ncbi:hydroxyacylglutathione hydrolase [Mycotypha africana]|uniref:hydroxyacylglutathione hydrolase n=1 Tax=Mycotypha africana TaxID=64632 RepID=UPI002300993C|nr:hydroxyacylglutathione hydrolase [Mycotypha africana]KAI8979075.1 hydroxyacylglutathione hydrolase [Mycotypha africana]